MTKIILDFDYFFTSKMYANDMEQISTLCIINGCAENVLVSKQNVQ